VLDFRRDEDQRLFLVMEYVEGKDLAGLLEAGPIPPSTIIFLAVEVLRGLGYAHDRADLVTGTRGIVHRDVSPQNVLLSYEGEVKVSDFGLARALDSGGLAASQTVRGKPSYMSPEQAAGDPLDNRSDLWAVGVMLWEMLAGVSLFTGTAREVIAQVLFRAISTPSSVRADVPADLQAVTMKLLARARDARYATAEAVIADLLRCRDAPLNGRDELATQLAARFPHPVLGSRRRGGVDAVPAERARLAARPAEPATTQTAPSTLGVAASQSIPLPDVRRSRWRQGVTWALSAAVVVGSLAGAVVARRRVGDAPVAAGARDAPVGGERPAMPANVVEARDAAGAVVPVDAPIPVDAPVRGDAPGPGDAAIPADAGRPASAIAVASPEAPRPAPTPKPTPAPAPRPTPRPAPLAATASTAEPGELVILVKPWATIWLNNKQVGATPFRKKLPSGRYVVRLANEDLGKNETIGITVESNKTTSLGRNW
jgi:serine/threonine-protein kinase